MKIYEEKSCETLLEIIERLAKINANSEFVKILKFKLKDFGANNLTQVDHFKEHLKIILKEVFKFWFLQKFGNLEGKVIEQALGTNLESQNIAAPPVMERRRSIFESNNGNQDTNKQPSQRMRLEKIDDLSGFF